MSEQIKNITLVVNNGELSELYNIVKMGSRHMDTKEYSVDGVRYSVSGMCNDWMNSMSRIYRTMNRYQLLFKGSEVTVLGEICVNYVTEYGYETDKGKLALKLCSLFDKKSWDGQSRKQREQIERLSAMELERAREVARLHQEQEERERQEQEQIQERRELQERAQQGNAWDTGVDDGNNGVWDANTADSPF